MMLFVGSINSTSNLYPYAYYFYKNGKLPQHSSFPLLSIATLSPRYSASSICCVVTMIVFPCFAFLINSHVSLLATGFIPTVGSSSKTNSELAGSKLIASCNFRYWEGDRSCTGQCCLWVKLAEVRVVGRSVRGVAESLWKKVRFSRTVIFSRRTFSWGQTLMKSVSRKEETS